MFTVSKSYILDKDCKIDFLTRLQPLVGNDKNLLLQVEKVLCGFPAANGGMVEEDFLVSINGQDIFDLNHAQVVGLIKNSGSTLRLAVER